MTQDPSQTQDPHGHPRYHTATLEDALAVLVTPHPPPLPSLCLSPWLTYASPAWYCILALSPLGPGC